MSSIRFRFIDNAFDFLTKVDEAIKDGRKSKEEPAKETGTEVLTLTESDLQQMKWMSPEQLYAIFGGGKHKKANIEGGMNAYRQLKWFSPEQIQAIFGKVDENE